MNHYIAISQTDLYYNAKTLIEAVEVPIIAVVKCNGYGLGIQTAVDAWYECGVRFFAVSEPAEALAIRAMGYEDIEILLLAPTWDEETIRALWEANVIMTVTNDACAAHLAAVCPARVHVKVNIGMGRFGLKWDRLEEIAAIYQVENLSFEGIFGHFPQTFGADDRVTLRQLNHFTQLIEALQTKGISVGTVHVANSCGALKYPQARMDAVRIGSALTGRLPGKVPCTLRPIGCLKAQIADLTDLEPGDTTGYSMVWTIKKPTKAAVVTAGYVDGWGVERHIPALCGTDVLRRMFYVFREGKTRCAVKWQGQSFPVLGRIGTQYTVVDKGNADCKPGDWVEISMNIMLADSQIPRKLEE